MSRVTDALSKESFSEPMLPMSECLLEIQGAEAKVWKNKINGEEYPVVGLMLKVVDPNAKCEHADARPGIIRDQFCLLPYPYIDKEGNKAAMRPNKLYQLEEAFGFDPIYVDEDGRPVELRINKMGNKVKPNVPGISRKINPDFYKAYFDENDHPKFGAFEGKKISADIDVDLGNDQFGPKNTVTRYRKVPTI